MKALLRITPLAFLLAPLAGCGGASGIADDVAKIVVQPRSVTSVNGTSATFYVTTTGSDVTYRWFKLVNGEGSSVPGAIGASLTLGNVVAGSAGQYYVVISHGTDDETSDAATLTVVSSAVAPSITVQPAPATVLTGALTTLSVDATGTNLTYQWKKDGLAISGATNPTYTIASAVASNAGSYTVTVTNSLGTLTSNAATLTVN